MDLEHVVILMQENRSFDHYFGTLRGVRGFGDPRPLVRPDGYSVFHQPRNDGSAEVLSPFRFDCASTSAQTIQSLDHSWKGSHDLWKWHDAWIPTKTPLTMGYFTRSDLPFYYALADAFTICDAYHCSIWGPTNPNRMFLFTGTSGLAAGENGPQVVINPPEEPNETADPANDAKDFKGFSWPTYGERLEAAGVSWKVYQEYDNYGDNALSYFASFRGLDPASPLYRKGRAWAEGSNADNAKVSEGEHLVAAFAHDVAADRLPQVSWIVAPTRLCEHPEHPPGAGEALTARLIEALTSNPDVWAKTALILNYDENDGFFDHVPPPVPPTGSASGSSTVTLDGELYRGQPVGLGPRVPMVVVSPWTKGGWVNSQTFDHTSVIRLLETRFGVVEPHITPWRRAITGDLLSVFDFAADDLRTVDLPPADDLPGKALAQADLPAPRPPQGPEPLPGQEPGSRPARALPYALAASALRDGDHLTLEIENAGSAGAALTLYPGKANVGGPWFYATEAGARLDDRLPVNAASYDFSLHGPNGFLRRFAGSVDDPVAVSHRYDSTRQRLEIVVRNLSKRAVTVRTAGGYARPTPRVLRLEVGGHAIDSWDIVPASHWYDVSVIVEGDELFLRRLAGHIETGRPSRSDPGLDLRSS